MAPDGRKDGRTERRTKGRTDNAKTISLRLWRGIINQLTNTYTNYSAASIAAAAANDAGAHADNAAAHDDDDDNIYALSYARNDNHCLLHYLQLNYADDECWERLLYYARNDNHSLCLFIDNPRNRLLPDYRP
ncbi:hypothetical protein DPMN_052040 [Dreissena polymorpha]|uniref:Uncharacterized protein n=1 Tax=Dreissena polymorpha TaxID=45954 RepID=A0A9D4CIY6_DREPO|nr:hypothetical protein DPMN_052040 [Dreissena polymorpha]